MAAIITDVSNDIKKLQQLKAEIESVKKALGGINVKVDIDIAKGMEAQLKSLMGQYEALARKVSETEGKILISTRRINEATEKIINAQNQMTGAGGSNAQTGGGTFSSQSETTNVQAQAKAYEDLEREINGVIGTREANIKRMVEEQAAIKLINAEIKEINKTKELSKGQRERLEQLNNSLLTHKMALAEVRQALMNNVKMDNAAATSINGLSQSLSRMRIAYRELTEEERHSPFGKELLASIQQADARIKQLDASIGNHQRNVGNYASSFNGLNMSVQQIVRELPSATMGLNMFFLAISNNLPILTDELKRAKEANDALKVSGQKGVPVWKQLVSSIFSWQSAMMVGITLLTVYGKDVANWVKGLFNAEKQLDATAEAQKKLNDAQLMGTQNAQEELVKLQLLRKTAEDKTKTDEERNRAVEKLQRMYPGYLGNLGKEKILAGEVAGAYNTLATDILNAARAKAAFDKAVESSKEESKLKDEFENVLSSYSDVWSSMGLDTPEAMRKRLSKLERTREEQTARANVRPRRDGLYYQLPESTEEKALRAILKAYDAWQAKAKETQKIIDGVKITDTSKVSDSNKLSEEQNNELKRLADERKRREEEIAKELLNLKNKNIDSEIELMAEGTEKKIAQIELDYAKEREAIKNQANKWAEEQGGTLTVEQAIQVVAGYSNAGKRRDKSILETRSEEAKKAAEKIKEITRAEEDAWNEYLIKFGNYQEKRKAIEDKYNKAIAEAKTEGDKLILGKERDNALDELDNAVKNSTTLMGQLFADASRKSVREIENIIDKAELLMDYLGATKDEQGNAQIDGQTVSRQNIIDLGISENSLENLETSTDEVESLRDAIARLKGELQGKSPFKLFEMQVEDAIKSIKSGGKDNIALGIQGIGKAVKEVSPSLSSLGQDFQKIFGNDELGNKISGVAEAIGGLGQTAMGVGQIAAGDIAGGIMSAVGGISTIIGSLNGLFGADYSGYERMVAQYENLLDIWDELVDKKKEYIDESYGKEAVQAAEEARQLIESQREATRELAKARLGSGSSAGSHSIDYRMWKGSYDFNGQNWKDVANDIARSLGVTFDSMDDMLSMSDDQLSWIKENYSGLWGVMDDDFRGYLEDLIAFGEEEADIAESLKERLTGITFDEAMNGLDELLMSADTTFKDISDNFEDYMRNSILGIVKGNYLSDAMNDWYEDFKKRVEDGNLSDDDVAKLRKDYENIYNNAQNRVNQMLNAAGLTFEGGESTQQDATSRGFGTEMTHEDAGELSGRFTAVYESNLRIEAANDRQTMAITELSGSIAELKLAYDRQESIADETRTILANSYLELQQISENTGEIIKPIKQMQSDISEIKRNLK